MLKESLIAQTSPKANEENIVIFNRNYKNKILTVAINLSDKEYILNAKKMVFGDGVIKNKSNIILQSGGFVLF